MATLRLDDTTLLVRLRRSEKLAALHGDVRVPLAAITAVAVEPEALGAARGMRAPGLSIPGSVKIGTWRARGRRTFVLARRDVAAVRVELAGAGFSHLLVSTRHAEAAVAAIREAARLDEGAGSGGASGSREVQVSFPSGDLRLTGTLALPAGAGPHPAVLLLGGSGEIDRDGDHPRMPLGAGRDLARALAAAGVASLRFDKRGVGASDGEYLSAGLTDNVDDARMALEWLRARPEVRPEAAFLVGHSEGACLAMALAGRPAAAGVAGVVLLAAPGKTGDETLAWQTRQIVPGLPRPVKLVLRLLRIDVVAKQAKSAGRIRASTTAVMRIGGRRLNARWLREFMAFDPRAQLARVRAPILAITGAKDLQVDPADLEIIAAAAAGPVETVLMPDLTHVLRRDPVTPTLSHYKQLLRQPIDAELVRLVVDWIVRHSPARAAAA